MRVRLKHDLWGSDEAIHLDLPERWNVSVLRMEGDDKSILKDEAYRKALAPLEAVLKGKKEICILFDDISRATRVYRIAPHLIELFEKCGIRDEQVRFLCALGTHAPLDGEAFTRKLGEEVMERFPVYNHNPYENCEHLGQTHLGTPILANKEFLSCDARIGIGSFVPHGFCGLGGGYKIVMPGIAHIDAITYHHGSLLQQNLAVCSPGRYSGNPLLEDVKEFGQKVRLDAKIDALINSEAEAVDISVGTPEEAYSRFADRTVAHYGTTVPWKADILFVNTFAKGNEATIGLSQASALLKDEGGYVVLLADISRGQVVHYLLGRFGKETWGRLGRGERVKDNNVRKVFVFSRYKDVAATYWFGKKEDVVWCRDLTEVIRILDDEYKGRAPDVHVIPDGTIQLANQAHGSCEVAD
ncbi:MAG TPA: lactate racemase domain-containing protein [Syntrophorhabdales bacterium]|nr:lactate racemase domain-containing protein [Syntrophorhabdales bacterium]